MRGIVATTFALVVVGCSIGALDGFSGGPEERDAAPDVTAPIDTDDASADAAAARDATTDEAAAPQGCDGGGYLFCTGFDEGTPSTGWTGAELVAGGTLGLAGDARSAPFALAAHLPAMTSETNQAARLFRQWPGALPVRVGFDMKIPLPSWNGSTEAFTVFHVLYASSKNESYLFRSPLETILSIEQNDDSARYQKVADLPFDTWVRVAFEMIPTPPTGTLRLSYDGKTVFENTAVPMATAPAPETFVFVGIARFNPPGPALDVLYDNVTIEQIP